MGYRGDLSAAWKKETRKREGKKKTLECCAMQTPSPFSVFLIDRTPLEYRPVDFCIVPAEMGISFNPFEHVERCSFSVQREILSCYGQSESVELFNTDLRVCHFLGDNIDGISALGRNR